MAPIPQPHSAVAVLGFVVWVGGGSEVAIFSAGVTDLCYRSDGSTISGEEGSSGGLRPPVAEAFSLIYKLILDSFEHVI